MKYDIIYGPNATSGIVDLFRHPGVLDCFDSAMERLAENPATLSKPSRLPFPKGQIYDFSCTVTPGRKIGFRAHFMYRANEAELLVFEVTADPYWLL